MWRADPLVWGRGPRAFEVFLEPTCPFSVKAIGSQEYAAQQERLRLQRLEPGKDEDE